MCFGPSTLLGAGAKTSPASSIKKSKPHLMYEYFIMYYINDDSAGGNRIWSSHGCAPSSHSTVSTDNATPGVCALDTNEAAAIRCCADVRGGDVVAATTVAPLATTALATATTADTSQCQALVLDPCHPSSRPCCQGLDCQPYFSNGQVTPRCVAKAPADGTCLATDEPCMIDRWCCSSQCNLITHSCGPAPAVGCDVRDGEGTATIFIHFYSLFLSASTDIPYCIPTSPCIRGRLASHVRSSIHIPYTIEIVAQADGVVVNINNNNNNNVVQGCRGARRA